MRIVGNLEGAAQMRLESVLLPDPPDRRRPQLSRARHRTAAPVRGRLGLLPGGPAHHHRDDLRRIGRLTPAARRVLLQTCPTLGDKATTPSRRLLLRDAKAYPNLTIGPPLDSQQHNESTFREPDRLDPTAT